MKIIAAIALASVMAAAPLVTQAQKLRVAVVVRVQNPDVISRYGRATARNIPVLDFDFRSAFADELMAKFSEATAAAADWRVAGSADSIPVILFTKNDEPVPASVAADRLLLVDVREYGILRGLGMAARFQLYASCKFVDRQGKKIWGMNKLGYTRKLDGKIEDIQSDDQKPLKQGLNAFIEGLVADMVKNQAKKIK